MSLKVSVIDSILQSLSNQDSANKAIVTIPSAVYYGRPYLFHGSEKDNARYFDGVDELVSLTGKLVSATYNETTVSGNDGCFMLKDVFMITAGATMELPYVVVFYDQVSSVAIGNYNFSG